MAVKKKKITFIALWGKTITAEDHLDLVLGAVKYLPLKYWRINFLFKGAFDSELCQLTGDRFPARPKKRGTHPVFALKPAEPGTALSGAGFKVCPCTTSYQGRKSKWIEKGTQLLHTGVIMDKRSYLVDRIQFNIPESVAEKLRFQGEVPKDAILFKM